MVNHPIPDTLPYPHPPLSLIIRQLTDHWIQHLLTNNFPRWQRTSCCSGGSCPPVWRTLGPGRSWVGATRPSRSVAWRPATWTGCSCTRRRRNSSSCVKGMTRWVAQSINIKYKIMNICLLKKWIVHLNDISYVSLAITCHQSPMINVYNLFSGILLQC